MLPLMVVAEGGGAGKETGDTEGEPDAEGPDAGTLKAWNLIMNNFAKHNVSTKKIK